MLDRSITIQIAVAGRVLAQAGLAANLGNHLSVVHDGRIYVNSFGRSLAALRPSDVVVVDTNGKVIEGTGRVNDTILLHSVLHDLVPSALAFVHTHAPNLLTVGTLGVIPGVYDQESTLLVDDIAIHDEAYNGPTDRPERIAPVAQLFHAVNAVLLPNHGALTAGKSLFLATLRMLRLEAMAKRHLDVHLAASALGRVPTPTDHAVALSTRDNLTALADRHNVGDLYWREWIDQVKRVDPSFDTAGFLD